MRSSPSSPPEGTDRGSRQANSPGDCHGRALRHGCHPVHLQPANDTGAATTCRKAPPVYYSTSDGQVPQLPVGGAASGWNGCHRRGSGPCWPDVRRPLSRSRTSCWSVGNVVVPAPNLEDTEGLKVLMVRRSWSRETVARTLLGIYRYDERKSLPRFVRPSGPKLLQPPPSSRYRPYATAHGE